MRELQRKIFKTIRIESNKTPHNLTSLHKNLTEIVGEMTKEFPKPPWEQIPNRKKWNNWIEAVLVWKEKWLMPVAEKSRVAEKEEEKMNGL